METMGKSQPLRAATGVDNQQFPLQGRHFRTSTARVGRQDQRLGESARLGIFRSQRGSRIQCQR
jgi:hypothetical protein